MIDIIGSAQTNNMNMENWYEIKQKLDRQFTILSFDHSEVLTLSVENLNRMDQEFPLIFENLWQR
jgi:hypothetical protein